MEYWKGMMSWPIAPDASCETCGTEFLNMAAPGLVFGVALTWGLVNSECRCNVCHTIYVMRDGSTILTRPLSRVKEEYKASATAGWKMFGTPIDEWTQEQWDQAQEATE